MCSFVPREGEKNKGFVIPKEESQSGREWGGGKDLGMVRAIKSDFLDQLWKMK